MRFEALFSWIRADPACNSFFYQSLFFGTNVDTSDVIQSVLDHRYRRAIFVFGNIDFIQQ
ncbi:hypothetical protein WS96_29500 [Burkholderia sp. MSMB1835]|nr:hypothetical protein WS96_29500 [Burkholderia sp. MSMB1835]